MNLRFKDIIAISVVALLSFPILYLSILFFTGTARIEFGAPGEFENQLQKVAQSARRDSLAALNSRTFRALEQERKKLEQERERLEAQQERLDIIVAEIESKREELKKERLRLEELVDESTALSEERQRELARLYGSMRPVEAALIIENLNDELAMSIITSINDDRQKSRILSNLSNQKASRISRMLGTPVE
ncbi:hypothetical protein QA601_12210 [Chitinispirillales bacterium ANBcel5]|uniref:MotE family protein n=1 Tax=Cellulosispirillum alkaliphilum TaxID=3039283 RepID=UPI002A55FA7C|nr:hypothetical protein [Chitinispirillales bacterium ANBcel5]